MKKSELLHLGLPKWPCMLVAGKSVRNHPGEFPEGPECDSGFFEG